MPGKSYNQLVCDSYDAPIDANIAGPIGNPAELNNWPMLKVAYRTDKDAIASLLPPGIEPGDEPNVYITFYNIPIQEAPEYGTVVNVAADYNGTPGEYTLGIGINQEHIIYPSKERWGQPKFFAETRYWRLGNTVEANVTHVGHTFAEFKGTVIGAQEPIADADSHEWWIKCMRDGDFTPGKYDFPPHVVHVYSRYGTAFQERVEGELILRDSKWDPIATRLPMREQLSSHLWTPTFLDRKITLAEELDGEKFWPFADTIGGSRWPGEGGGPPAR
jgi:acetoacetate decarboxylase